VSSPSNPEIVVIGAGAAGVGASLALTRLGIPHVVLEAKDRVGGRAYSETSSLGELWDHGCHWFHSADKNPLRMIAQRIGHSFLERQRPPVERSFIEGRWVNSSMREDYVWDELAKIPHAGRSGRDVAAATVLDPSHPWYPVVRHWVTLMYSVEAEQLSTFDAGQYEDTGVNLPVADGYGVLVSKMASSLPIKLSIPATKVSVTREGIAVFTRSGTIEAKGAIVAVPQRILADGRLAIEPDLPSETETALQDTPMGWYEKIALLFDGHVFPHPELPFLDIFDPVARETQPLNFELHPFGRPIAVTHVAGNAARDIVGAGAGAMTEYAIDLLVRAFGGDVRKRLVRGAASRWGSDPYIGGAYSAATPGNGKARAAFRHPIHERIFLAGEHTHPTAMATAHGAYLSGIDAAHRAAEAAGFPSMPQDHLWLPS